MRRWYAEVPHLGQLEFGLELPIGRRGWCAPGFEAGRGELRAPVLANLDFAADFVVKMTMAAVRTAARDYPKELASGALEAAVADMISGTWWARSSPASSGRPIRARAAPRCDRTRGSRA